MDEVIKRIEDELRGFVPDPQRPDDVFAVMAIEEAIGAAKNGNFGVGSVIVAPNGQVVLKAQNHVMLPYYLSRGHSEMLAVDAFEEKGKPARANLCTIYASLEPCKMCTGRLILSGIGTVRYLVLDPKGGDARDVYQSRGVFGEMAARQSWGLADCSPILSRLAWEIFDSTADALNAKL